MTTTDLFPDGSVHSVTGYITGHHVDGKREPVWAMLSRLGHTPSPVKHQKPEFPRRVVVAGVLLAGLLLGGCGGSFVPSYAPTSAPPATAPEPPRPVEEQVFLNVLDDEGIPYATADAIVEVGHTGCEYLDSGGSVFESIGMAEDAGYARYEAEFLVAAYVTVFCPEHSMAGA